MQRAAASDDDVHSLPNELFGNGQVFIELQPRRPTRLEHERLPLDIAKAAQGVAECII